MIKNPYAGKIIHFEGIDASGKSGQFLRFKNYLQAFHEAQFIWPDAILIYNVSAEEARKRLLAQGKELDVFEKDMDFQMKVRENYLAFAKEYPNCYVIDGSGQPEEVFTKTKEILIPMLGL